MVPRYGRSRTPSTAVQRTRIRRRRTQWTAGSALPDTVSSGLIRVPGTRSVHRILVDLPPLRHQYLLGDAL
eukprot:SAG11_NODE_24985_length_365_cov_0.744361_1_plen_70_part_10